MTTKYCKKCDYTKPLVDFPNNKTTKDGKHNYCKACNAIANKKFRDANPTYARQYWYNRTKPMIEAGRKAMNEGK